MKPDNTRSGAYQPQRSDFVLLNWTSQTGEKQTGKTLGLVLSPTDYNIDTGLILVCPITNQIRNGPWEVTIPNTCGIAGCILADQLRTLNWLERDAIFYSKASQNLADEVLTRIKSIVGL